jgi:hypothetical protein
MHNETSRNARSVAWPETCARLTFSSAIIGYPD